MTESGAQPPPPDKRLSTPSGGRHEQVATLTGYLVANRDRFTVEALAEAARSGGYPEDVVAEAIAGARADAGPSPTRVRARRWVLLAYLATFGVLTAGMFASESSRNYGAHIIGTVILAVTLLLALAISMFWLRALGRGFEGPPPGMVVLLAVPVILLVVVGGLCVGTGLPIPQRY